jgi:nicotinamidase-related amidase
MRPLTVAALAVLVTALPIAGAGAPPEAPAAPAQPATLVIIDVQNFYFPGGKLPLAGPVEASLKARALLEAFRARGWPVVHVLHLAKGQVGPNPEGGEEAYRAHPNVMPRPGEPVIGKREANAFRDTELLATLRRLGTTRLVIVGMQTQMCVEAATRAASDLGFQVTVVHDACASRSLAFGGVEVPAAQVHAAALAAMEGAYARVVSTAALLASLPQPLTR